MPLQNRVDPRGRVHGVSAHGALMGNRGIRHNEHHEAEKRYVSEFFDPE